MNKSNYARWKGDSMDRKRAVEEAIHSGEMEGAYVSDEFRADANEFARGDMSIEQLMQRAWRRNNHNDGASADDAELNIHSIERRSTGK